MPFTLQVYFVELPGLEVGELVLLAVWTTLNCVLCIVPTVAEDGETVRAEARILTVA